MEVAVACCYSKGTGVSAHDVGQGTAARRLTARQRRYSMQSVVGIFTSRAVAEHAAEQLCRLGIARDQVHFLVPGASPEQPEQVPTSDTEQPGMGPAIGGVVGGAMGASSGMMTATVLSVLVPGIGTVTAKGLAALS